MEQQSEPKAAWRPSVASGNFVNTNHIRAARRGEEGGMGAVERERERVEWKHSREGEKTERIRED